MMLMKNQDFQVVGTASNGVEAIEQVRRTHPDVMTLDIEMPEMNGLEVLDRMMEQDPLPIIIVSAHSEEGAEVTLNALERGAVDFIAKPLEPETSDIGLMEETLHCKVREAFQARDRLLKTGRRSACREKSRESLSLVKNDRNHSAVPLGRLEESFRKNYEGCLTKNCSGVFPLVVIGASTGGPNLLKRVIRDLPADFPAALLIVQHLPKYFTKVFAGQLDEVASIPICEAQDGDELRPGRGYVAPGDQHVMISRQTDGLSRIQMANSTVDDLYRPSIDCAMASAVEQFGSATVGVILTGMGQDGLKGCQSIKACGGTVLIQDEETSLISSMPHAVNEAGIADAVIPDIQLARRLAQVVSSIGITE